jgi:hypothetical protein
MTKTMDHAGIVETSSTRNYFTKYGLPLNMTRKERVSNLIGKKVNTLLAEQRKLPIIIQWKENDQHITQEEDKINMKSPPIQIKMKVHHQGDKRGHR